MTPNEMIAIERNALACSGVSPIGRCRLVSLSVIYGPGGTPQARIVKDTIKVWFQVLALNPVQIDHLNSAWAKARRFLAAQSKPQQHVMSIMSNVITILLAAKWMPYSPNRWVDPQGDHWLIDPEANSQVVSTAIIKDLHQLQLPRASGHYDGLGIQGGINWEYTLRFVRTLRLKPIHYCIQAALETVMCAACWPAQRIHDINNQFSPICPRCLNGPETSTHTFWECKANEEIDDEAVTSTHSLAQTAILRAKELPCLWLRGLLPESLLDTDAIPPPSDLPNLQFIGNPNLIWKDCIYYGDGSGGQFT